MGLVHEEDIVLPLPLRKEAGHGYDRVKDIVVVTDQGIAPVRQSQGEIVGAELPLLAEGTDTLPGERILPGQKVIEAVEKAVVVALRILARVGIAGRCLKKAGLVPGRNGQGLGGKSLLPEEGKGFFRHSPGHILGREVEYSFNISGPHGLDGRIYGGQGLSGPGRGLQEKGGRLIDTVIDLGNQLLLPFPVGEGEGQLLYGSIPLFLPMEREVRPALVIVNKAQKPAFQLFEGIGALEMTDLLLPVQIHIGEADGNLRKTVFQSKNIGIALSLGQVDRNRLRHLEDIPVDALDFVDGDRDILSSSGNKSLCCFLRNPVTRPLSESVIRLLRLFQCLSIINNAVCPAPDPKGIVPEIGRIGKGHLSMVIGPALLLDGPVNPAALIHCIHRID